MKICIYCDIVCGGPSTWNGVIKSNFGHSVCVYTTVTTTAAAAAVAIAVGAAATTAATATSTATAAGFVVWKC